MTIDRYRNQRKTTRNEDLYNYVLANPNITFQEVGAHFGISKQRAHELFKREERKKAATKVAA